MWWRLRVSTWEKSDGWQEPRFNGGRMHLWWCNGRGDGGLWLDLWLEKRSGLPMERQQSWAVLVGGLGPIMIICDLPIEFEEVSLHPWLHYSETTGRSEMNRRSHQTWLVLPLLGDRKPFQKSGWSAGNQEAKKQNVSKIKRQKATKCFGKCINCVLVVKIGKLPFKSAKL